MGAEITLRPQGQGKVLPWWLDTKDSEARKGTARIRSIDPNLIVGLDRRTKHYQVWGPSLVCRGWIAICECLDDQGRPYLGTVPWDRVTASLIEAREGMTASERAEQHNERMLAEKHAQRQREIAEGAEYYRRGIAGEAAGYGRHSGQDIADGWRSAKDSQKPAPVGQRIFAPGAQPETGGKG